MKKIFCFGAGKFFCNRIQEIKKWCSIAGIVDNNIAAHGTVVDGIPVYAPEVLLSTDFDYILITTLKSDEIKKQLLNFCIPNEKILTWNMFIEKNSEFFSDIVVSTKSGFNSSYPNVVVFTNYLDYDGGAIAVTYAVQALWARNYEVLVVARGITPRYEVELNSRKILFLVNDRILSLTTDDSEWIKLFDFAFVNVFQLIHCARFVKDIIPTLWWIHEPYEYFVETKELYPDDLNSSTWDNLNVKAVCSIPEKYMEEFMPGVCNGTLPYSIPDLAQNRIFLPKEDCSLTFALIGNTCERKGQKLFLEAIASLPENLCNKCNFWLIGGIYETEYCQSVVKIAAELNVKVWGQLTRDEIEALYPRIDVVLSPSKEDCLPIVMTEGMVYGKVIVSSDASGTANYIEDGVNGFICRSQSVESLSEKIRFIIEHQEMIPKLGKNARTIYEKYFTTKIFFERLENALLVAKKKFEKGRIFTTALLEE